MKPKILCINNIFPAPVNRKYTMTNAIVYYRQKKPAQYLPQYDFTFIGRELLDLNWETLQNVVVEYIKDHDLIYTKHLDNPYAITMLLSACSYYNRPLLVDFDDNLFTTDGFCPPQYSVPIDSPEYHYAKTFIQESTAITVSTKPIEDAYKSFNKNIHILPNLCDPKDWRGLEKKKNDRLTIGWAGSTSHILDHDMMVPVYEAIVKKYPRVLFSFLGHYREQDLDGILPRKNFRCSGGTTWWEGNPEHPITYPQLLAKQGYDIGLAPLMQSQMNQARSPVKWYEYSMLKIPIVASNWGPYKEVVYHQTDGLLCATTENWIEHISVLIENPDLREKLAQSAYARINREFTYDRLADRWGAVFDRYLEQGFGKKP